jgi:mandelate racemase
VIRALRAAIGPDVAIMVDYNQSLTPVEAIERLRILDAEGLALTWVEEPTLAHDYAGHARIARAAVTPIQCGENWWGPLDLQHAIDAEASDYMMPDVMKMGGITGWLRAAGLAHSRGILVSTHLWPEVSAQLLSLTPAAHWLEYADWWNPILREPLRIENGLAATTSVMGTGVEWDEDAIAGYLV